MKFALTEISFEIYYNIMIFTDKNEEVPANGDISDMT